MPRAHDRKHAPIPRRAHPDKGGDEATFVAVSEAYAVLLSARGRTVRASDESSSSDDEATRDTLSARIVDPHALFAATFGGGPARCSSARSCTQKLQYLRLFISASPLARRKRGYAIHAC